MLDWMKYNLESRLLGEISITSDMQMTPPLWQKMKRNSKASWCRWERKVKSWLKAQHSENEDHGIQPHHFMANRWRNSETMLTLFFWAPKSLQMVTAAMKLKDTPWMESYDQPRQHIKKQRHYFANKGPSSQSYGFSSSHVWMWELDYKESCAPKNWCFLSVVLAKTLESPLDCMGIQPVHPKGN